MMRQFSIKQLILSLSLIALACASSIYAFQAGGTAARKDVPQIGAKTELLIFYIAFTLLGVGVGVLFNRPKLGALIGGIAFIVFAVIAITISG